MVIKLAKTKKTPDDNISEEKTKTDKNNSNKNNAKETNIENDNPLNTQNELVEQLVEEKLSVEKDKYLRLAAEYDNFRKRSAKEREMIYTDARSDVIGKLLPVYDNLERALKMECSDDSFYKGVEMIMTQLTEVLSDIGVKEIPAVGEPFDPNLHNAVMSISDPNLGENIIAEEYQKGFILGDRVIRFSTVVVNNK